MKFSQIVSFIAVMMCVCMVSCSAIKNSEVNGGAVSKKFNIKSKVTLAEVDNLGRIYIVDDKNRIINFKPDFSEQYRYANKKSGIISSLDVTNPLRVVAFYDDFNQVKILDNTLTIITELNLADKFSDVSACGVTNDGNLWIFDPTQFKILKIKDNGTVILESSNVNDFGMSGVKITDIREKGNYVVLCDRNRGFYFFDNLGQYIFHFEAGDIRSFQFDGRNVYYYTTTGLKSYSIKFKERQIIGFPSEMNSPGLKYILFNAGDMIEVNEKGLNIARKVI